MASWKSKQGIQVDNILVGSDATGSNVKSLQCRQSTSGKSVYRCNMTNNRIAIPTERRTMHCVGRVRG